MSVNAGDAACTTGLSGSIWSAWSADGAAMLAGSPSGIAAAKAMIYRWSVAIASAHNGDAVVGEVWTARSSDLTWTTSGQQSTGLSFSMAASEVWAFEFVLDLSCGTGPIFSLNSSFGVTSVQYEAECWSTTTGKAWAQGTAMAATLSPGGLSTTRRLNRMAGIVQNAGTGPNVVTGYVGQATGGPTTTLFKGSYLRAMKLL